MTARRAVLAVLGPTASGKSALGLALAERYGGEIINCDSTAVYRGFDIGTDKLPLDARRGIPHHLIDIADPTEVYTAAQFARDAAACIRDIHARGHLPILVGGTGFYYRALTRGLFPGPGADEALRARLDRVASRRGVERLHRMLARLDPESARRIMPRDRQRLVRALEVYFSTGRPLTAHFTDTRSPPNASRGEWTNNSLAGSWTRFERSSHEGYHQRLAPSADWCIDRSWRCFAVCVVKQKRAR